MPLGMEVRLGSRDLVLDGDPAHCPPPQKWGAQTPIFGPCLLWPNGWKVEGLEKRLGLGRARSRSRSHLVAKIRRLGLVSWNCRKVLVSVSSPTKNRMSRSRLGLVS